MPRDGHWHGETHDRDSPYRKRPVLDFLLFVGLWGVTLALIGDAVWGLLRLR